MHTYQEVGQKGLKKILLAGNIRYNTTTILMDGEVSIHCMLGRGGGRDDHQVQVQVQTSLIAGRAPGGCSGGVTVV